MRQEHELPASHTMDIFGVKLKEGSVHPAFGALIFGANGLGRVQWIKKMPFTSWEDGGLINTHVMPAALNLNTILSLTAVLAGTCC